MKKLGAVLCLIVCISCKTSVDSQVKKNEISINQIKQDVEFLTSDALQGRYTGTKGIESAARYIENIFINRMEKNILSGVKMK